MAVNVRVEMRYTPGTGRSDRERAVNNLWRQFKRAVGDAGVIREIHAREAYEKPGDRKRRRQRQAAYQFQRTAQSSN